MGKQILLLLSMIFSGILSAEIKELHHFKELECSIGEPSDSDWLFFDIDYTLTEPSHPALQMSVIKQNKQRFKNELAKFSCEQKLLVPLLMVTQTTSQLTDPIIPALINNLQNKRIPIFGFTAIDTSSIPQIGSVPFWRVKELNRLGIHFCSTPFEKMAFTEFAPFRGTFPLYENGILYSNVTSSKGSVLVAFLNKLSHKPSRIVFIDDTLENLQSVEQELKRFDIAFLGLHYKAEIDETNVPKVMDDEWEAIWHTIRERAKVLNE